VATHAIHRTRTRDLTVPSPLRAAQERLETGYAGGPDQTPSCVAYCGSLSTRLDGAGIGLAVLPVGDGAVDEHACDLDLLHRTPRLMSDHYA
jgi:hypothetical protein